LINQWAVAFLDQEFTRPFCLVVSHEAVHYPFLPAPRHEDLYRDLVVPLRGPDPEGRRGKHALNRALPNGGEPHWFGLLDANPEPSEPRRGRPTDLPSLVRDQLRCLAAVDEGLGQILAVLERRGRQADTLVVFTSDQGYLHGEFGLYRDKRWPYDPCLRVPFLVRYPRLIKAGTRVDAMVLSIDLVPTLLELTGTRWYSRLHGKSFVGLLTRPDMAWRNSFLFEHFVERVTPRCPRYFAVRTQMWKYIHFPTLAGMDELYDLASDPGERHNVIAAARHSRQLGRMQAELQRLSRASENPFPLQLHRDASQDGSTRQER
jgi:N-acetylglucosamine-6-sulfatase